MVGKRSILVCNLLTIIENYDSPIQRGLDIRHPTVNLPTLYFTFPGVVMDKGRQGKFGLFHGRCICRLLVMNCK